MSDLRTTPLHDRHAALGASFTDFGGWSMPVRYTSDLAEHHAVRQAAGLFDISHMAEFTVSGTGSTAFLERVLAGRFAAMSIGKAKYSLLLSDAGGVIDDVIVYRLGDERYLVISNAGNRDAVFEAFRQRVATAGITAAVSLTPSNALPLDLQLSTNDGATIEDISDGVSLIAVQGPRARAILENTTGIDAITPAVVDLGYYAWSSGTFQGADLFIARTGYTGEDGFELLVPNAAAPALWDALLASGEPLGLVPAGLASRDTLRLEAGMPLHGHELSDRILPAQAGLGRVVASDKGDFVGKAALAEAPADLPVLVGLAAEGRRAGRAGYAVYAGAEGGDPVGEITSGALSPTLGHPIAMAFVPPALADIGTELFIDVRGTRIPATVTALPFYRRTA
ncbi:glycine cleavage system aminomethyltransferase GcvT [Microbacterium sp.]|uniref:glycine cleavage system aminomethyltransferase GcvT n=1 Tax=Microbacterium sp. TaxID=51671 RepID=UPI0025D920D8|nr:glycine cleavage system aminomethyltransferase GcvT [Microbacterium sp.]